MCSCNLCSFNVHTPTVTDKLCSKYTKIKHVNYFALICSIFYCCLRSSVRFFPACFIYPVLFWPLPNLISASFELCKNLHSSLFCTNGEKKILRLLLLLIKTTEAAALQQILSLFPAHLKANKRTSSDLWITAPIILEKQKHNKNLSAWLLVDVGASVNSCQLPYPQKALQEMTSLQTRSLIWRSSPAESDAP